MRSGFFIKPYKVMSENGEKIVKKLPYNVKKGDVEVFRKLHEGYIKLLLEAGVMIPETTLDFKESEKGFTPVITQPAFREDELLDNIIYNASKKSVLNAYRKMLEANFKVINFNKKNLVKVGFDGTPRNLAWKGNKIYYFDTFPFFIKKEGETPRELIKGQVRKGLRFFSIFGFNKVSEQFFKPEKMIRAVFASSVKRRPEFKEDFKKITREVVEKHVEPSEVEKFLNFKRSLISRVVSKVRHS